MTNADRPTLIIDGHPDAESFGRHLADAYEAGARAAGFPVERLNVRDLAFDPILHYGYRQVQPLEPDLLRAQELIRRNRHLVWIAPMWWGGLPGQLKGFIDRTFIRDFSHRFDPERKLPVKLLTGRSATMLYTQSSPLWYTTLVHRDHFWRMVRGSIFEFVGFHPIRRRCYAGVKSCSDAVRRSMLEDARERGRQGF